MSHPVKMSDSEKSDWFKKQIELALKIRKIESEEDLIRMVRDLRVSFKKLFDRDVPGSFIRRLMVELGVKREYGEGVKIKREWMFDQMNKNQALRENKTQMRKAIIDHFKEEILGIVFDELWDEYHSESRPEPSMNIDIYGQGSIFD